MILDVTGRLRLTHRTWDWCQLPYPGHPHGCPNYEHKVGCPPHTGWIEDLADLGRHHYFVVLSFDLQAHEERMLTKHPEWSSRQARCCLYWQSEVRRDLEHLAARLAPSGYRHTLCPEAMGVNVIATLRAMGQPIEVKPMATVRKVALLYLPVENAR